MGRRVILACVLTALVVVPSVMPQTVVGLTAFRAATLGDLMTRAFSVTCPPGYLAVSAGVAKAGAGVTTLEARPLTLRAFTFRVANASGSGQRVIVAASCRRVRAAEGTAPFLRLTALHRETVRVTPNSLRTTHFTCPSGTVPAAAGFDLDRGVSLRRETQNLRTLTFGAFNRASTPRTVSFYGGCLTVVRRSGASAMQLQVSLATDTVPVEPGARVVTLLCPRGWLSLAVGYSLPAGLELNGAAAVARTGRWSLTNSGQTTAAAQLQLACARLT